MKSNFWFYFGLGINVISLLIAASNMWVMRPAAAFAVGNGNYVSPMDSLTPHGRMMLWLAPLTLLGLIAVACWLKSAGKMLAANILLWIPALPMLVALVVCGGLVVLFILFGK